MQSHSHGALGTGPLQGTPEPGAIDALPCEPWNAAAMQGWQQARPETVLEDVMPSIETDKNKCDYVLKKGMNISGYIYMYIYTHTHIYIYI